MKKSSEELSQSPGQVARASMVGSVLDFYDWQLFGVVAALVIGRLFFPNVSPLAGTLAAFGTLAVGFVARPLGGILFGHFGDRVGRKTMLIITISMMGVATALIGAMPTYDQAGIAAPILLTICRFFQGIAHGGEWGGAVLMAVEYAPPNKRGYYSSIVQVGGPAGLTLASGTLFAFSYILGADNFLTWGWRIPFLMSIVLLFLGLWIRLKISETPTFKKLQATHAVVKLPILDVLRQHKKAVLGIMLIYLGGVNVPFYTAWVTMVYYANTFLKIDRSSVLMGLCFVNAILCFSTLLGGIASDRLGRRKALAIGLGLHVLGAFPAFMIADLAEVKWVALAMFIIGFPCWFVFGIIAAYFSEMFPPQLRYTGISLGSQAATILGGSIPIYSTAALAHYGTWPISALIVFTEILAFIAAFVILRPSYQATLYQESHA